MECSPKFQMLPLVGRSILNVGMIITVLLVFQSSLFPFGNDVLSLRKSVMVCEMTHLHDYNSTGRGKILDGESETKGNDKSSQTEEEDPKSDNKLVGDEEKVVRSDREDTGLVVEKVETAEASFASPQLKGTFFSESNTNSSEIDVPINSPISLKGKRVIETLPKAEKHVMLQRCSVASSNNSTSIYAMLEDKGLVTSILEMSNLLIQSRVSSRARRPCWSTVRDRELLSAKSQIENAPIIWNDPELHAPVFRNISTFKRSYELMEHMLKVYIYSEGEKPVFHKPRLRGIYGSEGWFMTQMEGNEQFVVQDPRKAHLFYLPFSSLLLREMNELLTQQNKRLTGYLKDYLDMIAGNYYFWNRTGGADHFLVACHDWAPKLTIGFMGNCIRALCNANVAKDFKIGKDVSLPVTFVRTYKEDPLKNLGGMPPSMRSILAFFAGSNHGNLRPILLQYWANKDPDMKIFGHLPRNVSGGEMDYIQYMKNSKYCICAKGYEVHTPRVFEAIFF